MERQQGSIWRRRVGPVLATAVISGGAMVATAGAANAASTADFTAGVLSVRGDNADNALTISRNAAGTILINGGAIPVAGGTPTVANTTLIQAFGLGGNDVIALNESNGALPRANLSAAKATTSSPVARVPTWCSARAATTHCSASTAPINFSAATAMTSSLAGTPTTRPSVRAATTG